MVKNLPANVGDARDMGSIPGSGRSPGEGNGHLLQYSCLESSMDRGAQQATVHGVAKSQTGVSALTHRHTHIQVVPICCQVWGPNALLNQMPTF